MKHSTKALDQGQTLEPEMHQYQQHVLVLYQNLHGNKKQGKKKSSLPKGVRSGAPVASRLTDVHSNMAQLQAQMENR